MRAGGAPGGDGRGVEHEDVDAAVAHLHRQAGAKAGHERLGRRVQRRERRHDKLDAIEDPARGFDNISAALRAFAVQAGIVVTDIVPISALKGHNVVTREPGWANYQGPSLLQILEQLPVAPSEPGLAPSFSVQWVEKFSSSSDTSQGRRVFWGRVNSGSFKPGQTVQVLPSGQTATVARVLNHVRQEGAVEAGQPLLLSQRPHVATERQTELIVQAGHAVPL